MIRQIIAIIIAVIAGVAVAKFVEGMIGGGVAPDQAASVREIWGLAIGWFFGAFAASAIALLLGRRWAPLGWLAAVTILFSAIMTMLGFSLPMLLWPAAIVATGAGGYLAGRVLKAKKEYPSPKAKGQVFD